MPQTKYDLIYKDECTDKCRTHRNKTLEFFCEDHREFGCIICRFAHETCNFGYIPTLAENLFQTQEYQIFRNTLHSLAKKTISVRDAATENFDDIKKSANKALGEIRDIRKEINKPFDEIEKEISDRVLEIQREDQTKIGHILKEYKTLADEIKQIQQGLKDKENKQQKCRLFADMKQSQEMINRCQNVVKKAAKNNPCRKPEFIPSTCVFNLIRDTSIKLGSLVSYDKSLSVKSDTDTKDKCSISDIVMLSDGKIAVADHINNSVKIVDIKCERLIISHQVSGYKGGLAAVSDIEIVLPRKGNIEFYSVTVKIDLKKTIEKTGLGLAIVYKNRRFIGCTYSSPYTVKMVNMQGEVIKTFPTETQGEHSDVLFIDPSYIAISPEQRVVYVSDVGNNTVTCMTLEGEVKAQYRPKSGWWPHDVTVSREGTVYVCDGSNDNIHVLTPDLQERGVINCVKYGLGKPLGLAYCDKEHKLYVGITGSRDHIAVFNIES